MVPYLILPILVCQYQCITTLKHTFHDLSPIIVTLIITPKCHPQNKKERTVDTGKELAFVSEEEHNKTETA